MPRLKYAAIILVLLLTLGAAVACQQQPDGVVEGIVTIGPIFPVERPDSPPVPPEVFAARKIVIYDRSGKSLIKQTDIVQVDREARGRYRVELRPGTYVVNINRLGIDSSSDVPKTVTVASGQRVELNIDIDTGIR
ncbi:MAG: hypothetical protein HY530_08125 [Chloroflexi bacterium]|nr:hypothetical protein [Chloroflexota bacterium]